MEDITMLPEEIVAAIIECKNKTWEEDQLQTEFQNLLLREDVLELLDRYCTVIYYPLLDEKENNGFHITGILDIKGNEKHFVFINTAQTMEKQVFTAAHELGHIWEVDEYVKECCDVVLDNRLRELIMNRFAAELLIPKEQFYASFRSEYEKFKNDESSITVANMLKVIVALMNQFFVPRKSIILRCVELKIISEKTAELLLGMGAISGDVIETRINEIIRDNGYIKFQKPSEKKWIEGLAELLDYAEETKAVTQSKIDHMRETFELSPQSAADEQMDEVMKIEGRGYE